MSALGWNSTGLPQGSTRVRLEEPRTTAGRKRLPNVEHLEQLLLLSADCPVISGFVFLDQNHNPALTNNGILNAGELPVPNAQVELFDASNHLIATTRTDSHGAYSFDGLPNPNATPVTLPSQTIALGSTLTPYSNKQFTPSAVNLFDPDLGTLTSVTITHTATFNSTVNTQNLSPSSTANITASLQGSYVINGLSQIISGTGSASQGPFADGPFDPANPDSNKLPPIHLSSTDAPAAVKLTSASDLAFFTASGNHTTITPTMSATGFATATSDAGGLNTSVVTAALGGVTVTYTYIPRKCIANGKYTLVQTPNPPQLINGKESQPGVVFPAPPVGQPQKLSVTVDNADLPNNDFAKLSAGNPNPQPPGIGTLVRFGVHHQQTTLLLTFTGTVDPTLANKASNYFVTTSTGARVRIVAAKFDPATNSVLLIPAQKLNVHLFYDLSVKLPSTAVNETVVVRFGGLKSLGGFTNHEGQFVPVVNGIVPHDHGPAAHVKVHAHGKGHA